MAYTGTSIPLDVGSGGLLTDAAQSNIPLNNIITAVNVSTKNGVLMKDYGASRWNATSLGSEVVALFDYQPSSNTHRRIVVCKNGKVYKFIDRFTAIEITAETGSTAILSLQDQVYFLQCGEEDAGDDRKLFIFTGSSPIQVIVLDGNTRRDISGPATDWSATYPTMGIIYNNRVWAFGNGNAPHRIYASSPTDHEDFTSVYAMFTNEIFPGIGDRLQTGFVFKNKLFIMKYPYGIFGLEVQDVGDITTWYFQLLNKSLGAASVNCFAEIPDDILFANSQGGISSIKATFQLGDVSASNVLKDLKIERHILENVSLSGLGKRHALYWDTEKRLYFVFGDKTGSNNTVTTVFDMTDKPNVFLSKKEYASCMGLLFENDGAYKPYFGSTDGYIYSAFDETKLINGNSYKSFYQTPFSDLGVPFDKNFDFLELCIVPTGNQYLYVDVFIDGQCLQTLEYDLSRGSSCLDVMKLDESDVEGNNTIRIVKPIESRGETISFRVTSFGDFKIDKMVCYFRPSGIEEKK